MREEGLMFDAAHTSVLKRAIRTNFTALDVMDQLYVPVCKSWRLNERHYGALQGLDKAETTAKHGEAQEIGRASCRERVGQYVELPGVGGTIKKKTTPYTSKKKLQR